MKIYVAGASKERNERAKPFIRAARCIFALLTTGCFDTDGGLLEYLKGFK
jgi:hypothetical protein